MSRDFVNLHNHSEYSLLDGAAKLKDMVAFAKDNGQRGIALTDHGTMHGSFEFYQKCRAEGVKPLVGCELYVATRSHDQREAGVDGNHHLVAIAKNFEGYQNLLKLTTKAYLEGFYYKPRVDKAMLAEHSEGLIIASACMGGEMCQCFMDTSKDIKDAERTAAWYKDVFGEDFYLEVQGHGMAGQPEVNRQLAGLADRTGIKLLATMDAHYVNAADANAHDVLVCLQTGRNIYDPTRMRYEPRNFHLKTHDEMLAYFEAENMADAVENTMEVFEKVNLEIPTGDAPLPKIGLLPNLDARQTLRQTAFDGLRNRLPDHSAVYIERLNYELDVIEQMGFSQYFLVFADITKFAREKKIRFGPRGSAAGALTSYCIGITDIDPVEYGLAFERFLNPERVSMPDIDMDFQDNRRQEVVRHLEETYGKDAVAFITTFGMLGAKASIRDTARVLAIPLSDADRIAKYIPKLPLSMSIEKTMYGWPEKHWPGSPDMVKEYETDPVVRNLIDTARSIEGTAKAMSIHASGIMVADRPLSDYTPLRTAKSKDKLTDVYVTQYPHSSLETLGLLKLDILGLINLTILDKAIRLIEKTRGIKIDPWTLPLGFDDPMASKAYDMLGRAETVGVFQLEGGGMRKYLAELKPQSVREIAAMVALYRPGPMAHIPRYIQSKYDESQIRYTHPILEPILKETYGVIVYQDQVLEIAKAVAGMTMGQADLLRRAMGKKKQSEMDAQRELFVSGAIKKGISEKVATEIFDEIEPFAGYAFNKAHATCYAMLAFQTAYLKANYSPEYMASLLSAFADKGYEDKVAASAEECSNLGVQVFPPHINFSETDFTPDVENNAIWYGIGAIKSINSLSAEAVVTAVKQGGDIDQLFEFAQRTYAVGNRRGDTGNLLFKVGALTGLHDMPLTSLSDAENATAFAWAKREMQFGSDDAKELVMPTPQTKGEHIIAADYGDDKEKVLLITVPALSEPEPHLLERLNDKLHEAEWETDFGGNKVILKIPLSYGQEKSAAGYAELQLPFTIQADHFLRNIGQRLPGFEFATYYRSAQKS